MGRALIETDKRRRRQIQLVAGPLVDTVTSTHHVEIGRKIIPEFLVVAEVARSRTVELIDLPVGTPVLALAYVGGNLAEHIGVVAVETEQTGPDNLMRNVAHTESVASGQSGLIPYADRIIGVVDITERHVARPAVSVFERTVARLKTGRRPRGRHDNCSECHRPKYQS